MSDIIIGMAILYGNPAALFKYKNGYAWKYKNEITDLGDVSEKEAVEKFKQKFPYIY